MFMAEVLVTQLYSPGGITLQCASLLLLQISSVGKVRGQDIVLPAWLVF